MRSWRIWAIRIIVALAGIGGGLGTYTFYYAEGWSYMSNDPKACVNCHVMRDQFAGWQKSSHHAVATCNDCHLPARGLMKWVIKAENGFWHSKAFTMQDFKEPIRIRSHNRRVLQSNCVRCHEGLVDQIVARDRLDEHEKGCVGCHAGVGHNVMN